MVLLRIYVGVLWLIEGVHKIQDGWLVPGNIKIVQVASTTGASAAAETGEAAVVYATPILAQPPAFYQWFTDAVVAPNAGMFQFMVVLMEVGIGLALIAGLFTFFASIASLGLVANFVLSAQTGWDILWFVFAAIALMGGSGGAFSLDYYVQPWIKKWWKNTKLAQGSYLYFD
jgi:NADH dehydrogenase